MKNKLILLFGLMILLVGTMSAFSTNTFNNSLSRENITFTGNQNITRWLQIPQSTYLTNGYLNLSGIVTTNITTCTQLQNIQNDLTGIYILGNNINCSGFSFTPIGVFQGVLYGQGYNISNVVIDTTFTGTGPGGLFSQAKNALIRDVGLINFNVIGGNGGAGALIGNTVDNPGNVNIINVFVMDSSISAKTGGFSGAGGIIGVAYTSVTVTKSFVLNTNISCCSGGSTNDDGAGGIIGDGVNSILNQTYSNAKVSMSGAGHVGGLIASFSSPTCYNSFWDNQTSGQLLSACGTGKTTTQMNQQATFTNWDFTNVWNINEGINYPELRMSNIYSTNYYPMNLAIWIGNNKVINYTGYFNQTNNKTSNLASFIDSYLSSCSYVSGYCNIPFILHSDTVGILQYSSLLFSNAGILELSSNYLNNTYETEHNIFNIIINYDNIEYPFITGNLIYNGISYLATKTTLNNNASFEVDIDIPLVDINESQLNNFYWSIIVTNSTGTSFTTLTATQYQNVSKIHFTPCGTYNVSAVNFTAYYESNLSKIDPFLFQGTFNVWFGDGDVKKTETINNVTISEMKICISPSTKLYNTTAEIKYDGADAGEFISRNYYYNKYIFNSTNKEVHLFLLEPSLSTSFIIYVRDQTLQAVPGALVYTDRYYPGTDTYETVQIGKTGDSGKTVGFFVTETVDYRFRVLVNGEEVLITNKQKMAPETAPFTITLTTGVQPDNPLVTFDELSDFDGTLSYDNDTSLVTFTYQDYTGNLSLARLYVEKINSGTLNTVICNTSSSSLAATLSCDVSAYDEGTFLAQAFVSRSPESLTKAIQFIRSLVATTFGNTGLLLAWFLILTTAMTMIWNPTVGIIGVNAMMILVNLIGLASFPPLVIFALIALSITIIIVMKT